MVCPREEGYDEATDAIAGLRKDGRASLQVNHGLSLFLDRNYLGIPICGLCGFLPPRD